MRLALLALMLVPTAAPAADWWAARPLPPVAPGMTIDAAIDARLKREGLTPAPPADRLTLVRRATWTLTGLPPTPEEAAAFLADTRPDAYERLVDRLLASPRFGERLAAFWLDLVRFNESDGFERDELRPGAWPYRDFVVRAFNDDLPYPEFVRRQIAGDALNTPDGLAATGFLVGGPFDTVAATAASPTVRVSAREDELEDILATVGQTFLGLTLNCARCHDHKFDPVPLEDYYRAQAAFAGTRRGERAALPPEYDALTREAATLRSRAGGPAARWDFEGDARDRVGGAHLTLSGGARIERGTLVLPGGASVAETGPLPFPLKAKTLQAWVTLDTPVQRGGGVLSAERPDGTAFDALVFGERVPGRWFPGSEGFVRSADLSGIAESAGPTRPVHLALTIAPDGRVTMYRDGAAYGAPYTPAAPLTLESGAWRVLLGRRHTGVRNGDFRGTVLEARLYERALSVAEIRASAPGVAPPSAPPAERERLRAVEARLAEMRERARVYAVTGGPAPKTFVLARGNPTKPGARVTPRGLSAVTTHSPALDLRADAPDAARRKAFADWLASPDNAALWRVAANRVWQWHFGTGVVATASDFGNAGEPPSHPELLDLLASELESSGGRLKSLHRRIVLSAAFRRASTHDPRAAAKDAESRLLWRYPPRRLEAEALRDGVLAVSGRLQEVGGGPGFRPFRVEKFNATFYRPIESDELAFNRRSLYRTRVNSARDPLLEGFDCPDPSVRTARRVPTTTPQQALELMNGPFLCQQAARLAERVSREAGASREAQVRRFFALAYQREPTPAEAARAATLLAEHGGAALAWALWNSSEWLTVR